MPPHAVQERRPRAREMDWTCLPGRADRVVLGSVAHAGCVGAARAALNAAPRRRVPLGYFVLALAAGFVAAARVRRTVV